MVSARLLIAFGLLAFVAAASAKTTYLLQPGGGDARLKICDVMDITSASANKAYAKWANKNSANRKTASDFVTLCKADVDGIAGTGAATDQADDVALIAVACNRLYAITSANGLTLVPECEPCHIYSQAYSTGTSDVQTNCVAKNGQCVASGAYPGYSCVCKPGYVFDKPNAADGTGFPDEDSDFPNYKQPAYDCKKKDIKCNPKAKKNGCGQDSVCHFETKICTKSCFGQDSACTALGADAYCHKNVCVDPIDDATKACYRDKDCAKYAEAAYNSYKCSPKNICIFNSLNNP